MIESLRTRLQHGLTNQDTSNVEWLINQFHTEIIPRLRNLPDFNIILPGARNAVESESNIHENNTSVQGGFSRPGQSSRGPVSSMPSYGNENIDPDLLVEQIAGQVHAMPYAEGLTALEARRSGQEVIVEETEAQQEDEANEGILDDAASDTPSWGRNFDNDWTAS